MRIVFAGDIHGNGNHLKWVMNEAADRAADVVYSVGDFGYWPHFESGQDFLRLAHDLAQDHAIPIMWIPGNHENWDVLDALVAQHGNERPIPTPAKDKRYRASQWVQFVPRGCVMDFDGTTVLGVGGAYSVDWKHREKGVSWWPQEKITPEIVDSIDSGPVDILVTHEAPQGPGISYKDDILLSTVQRELISEIVEKVTPSLVVCGHHHTRETWRDRATGAEVQVLNRDWDYYRKGQPTDPRGAEESILLVDTTKWRRERQQALIEQRS